MNSVNKEYKNRSLKVEGVFESLPVKGRIMYKKLNHAIARIAYIVKNKYSKEKAKQSIFLLQREKKSID